MPEKVVDIDKPLDLTTKTIAELKEKYQVAIDKRQNWIEFQDKLLSRNFVSYVLAYYAEPEGSDE